MGSGWRTVGWLASTATQTSPPKVAAAEWRQPRGADDVLLVLVLVPSAIAIAYPTQVLLHLLSIPDLNSIVAFYSRRKREHIQVVVIILSSCNVGTIVAAAILSRHRHPQPISPGRHSPTQFQLHSFYPRHQRTECLRSICLEITSTKTCLFAYNKKSCQCSLNYVVRQDRGQISPYGN